MFSNTILISNFIMKAFKQIGYWLDYAVFYFARTAYKVFYFMANVTLVNDNMIETFTQRIYAILGLIMLFVLAFNLLNYIIDPDKINDKKIGAVSFLKDVVIALVVITVLPQIFTMLYSLQNQILTSNVLSNLILGGYTSSEGATDEGWLRNQHNYKSKTAYYVDKGADTMVANVYVAFVTPKDEFSVLDCARDDGSHEEYCKAYDDAIDKGSIEPFYDLLMQDKYNYTPLISTAAGVILLFFMLSYCLELAKRVGKMAILQLLAPVPFVMEILPNKKGTRKNWIDTTVKVFLDVFMFQATIYVIILLITFIPSAIANVFASNPSAGGFVKTVVIVLLIFGLLQFGKEAPKMITDLLGIKDGGTLGSVAKRALAMGGVTAGMLGSTAGRGLRNAFATYRATEGGGFKKTMSAIGSGFAGAGSGVARTLWGSRNVHNWKDAMKLNSQVNKDIVTARVKRDAYQHAHGGFWGAMGGHIQDAGASIGRGFRGYVGTQNEYERKSEIDRVNSEYKKLYEDKIESIWKNNGQWQAADSDYKRYDSLIESGAVSASDIDRQTGKSYGDLRSEAKQLRDYVREEQIRKNGLKLMQGAGELNNFIDTHQGIDGVTFDRLDIEKSVKRVRNARGEIEIQGDVDFVSGARKSLESRVTKGRSSKPHEGYEKELGRLKKDIDYQKQKVEEKVHKDAAARTQQAADDANKGKK